ncbi:MAG: NADH-quinone oxidoreductase subunit NuoH [Bacteroidota bacterium]
MEFFIITFIKIVFILIVLLLTVAYTTLAERRISAAIQNRLGPNRVGWQGLLQPIADVMKLFIKEDIVPKASNRFIHNLAPVISLTVALTTFAVIPFGDRITIFGYDVKLQIADVNIGVLYILALTSMGVYGITLSGWSSGSKYSLLGGLRSSAQMISYELSMGLSVIGVVMVAGTLQLDGIVKAQSGWHWNIVLQPIGFITFLVASFAETNRLPFDLPEAEPELVGGYLTEYSGMRFGSFYLSEYMNMVVSASLVSTLYLGGWQFPYLQTFGFSPFVTTIIQFFTLGAKIVFMIFFYIWVRWTIPRFRYDQLMNMGWKMMLPLSIANIIVTGIVLLLI